MTAAPQNCEPVLGCLLGTAVGDAMGLPTEGISREQARRFQRSSLGHRLIFGHGMFSDDTEHTLMVATALMQHPDAPAAFQCALARSLRWWFLALPAGVGLSTAKALLRLWLGVPPHRAGVRSAGNGAAMRGAAFPDDETKRHAFALAACRLTHTDPRAEESAMLVSEAAALAVHRTDTPTILDTLRSLVKSQEMQERLTVLEISLKNGFSVPAYATEIGCEKGVSGFAPNTVAVALYAWLRHRGDFKEILTQVIFCGGDTDTVAAVAGGISGTETPESQMPAEWISGLCDWPRSVPYIRRLAEALPRRLAGEMVSLPALPAIMILPRNLVFLDIVLAHGFRRLLPPY